MEQLPNLFYSQSEKCCMCFIWDTEHFDSQPLYTSLGPIILRFKKKQTHCTILC